MEGDAREACYGDIHLHVTALDSKTQLVIWEKVSLQGAAWPRRHHDVQLPTWPNKPDVLALPKYLMWKDFESYCERVSHSLAKDGGKSYSMHVFNNRTTSTVRAHD